MFLLPFLSTDSWVAKNHFRSFTSRCHAEERWIWRPSACSNMASLSVDDPQEEEDFPGRLLHQVTTIMVTNYVFLFSRCHQTTFLFFTLFRLLFGTMQNFWKIYYVVNNSRISTVKMLGVAHHFTRQQQPRIQTAWEYCFNPAVRLISSFFL